MPLDGHSYLVSQGWAGKGTGLRLGAIIRPLAIPKKQNLAGLGKARDESFPFWDHIFSSAAKSIRLKVENNDNQEPDSQMDSSTPFPHIRTEIFSHCSPTDVVAPLAFTPSQDMTQSQNKLAVSKREAAKTLLYNRFFRGSVVAFDVSDQLAQGEELCIKVRKVNQRKRIKPEGINNEDLRENEKRRKKESLEECNTYPLPLNYFCKRIDLSMSAPLEQEGIFRSEGAANTGLALTRRNEVIRIPFPAPEVDKNQPVVKALERRDTTGTEKKRRKEC